MPRNRDQDREIISSAWSRGAKLASFPLGVAGRATKGLGRRLGGNTAEQVNAQLRQESAEQLFRVLGELKGGAMKFGQVMSLFEAVLPEDVAGPYRVHLKRLQDSAPPMPISRVQAVMAREFGPQWRSMFTEFHPRPAAAASIGQVHRGVWAADGQPVAIKVQYPGADEALASDLKQISRLASVIAPLAGGIEVKPIVSELTARISEETDYELEAANQQQAAQAFGSEHPEFFVPRVLTHTGKVMVSQWVDGTRLADVAEWPVERRNQVGLAYVRFLFAAPSMTGLLHGDPHPGNFKVLPDGRFAAVDWGLVSRMPDGLPVAMGRLLRIAAEGDAHTMTEGLKELGFIAKNAGHVDAKAMLEYLSPFIEPAEVEEFHFTRDWMRQEFRRVAAAKDTEVMRSLNLPPTYALIHRVWIGGIAVLSQLDVKARFADVLDEFLPGWLE